MKISPKVKFWLSTENREGVFGGGKHRLLKAIEEYGSLSAAADHLNISYRKAWGDLKKAEEGLGARLVDRKRGGSRGGQTSLTPQGRRLVEAYSLFADEMNVQIQRVYREILESKLYEADED